MTNTTDVSDMKGVNLIVCRIHELPSSQEIGDDSRQGVDYFVS